MPNIRMSCIVIAIAMLMGGAAAAAASNSSAYACTSPNSASFAFCNRRLSIDNRVADLISRLNLSEKIAQIVDNASGVPRLGVPPYEWWSEALHGVSDVGPGTFFTASASGSGPATPLIPAAVSFPQVILTAASFNSSLWTTIGQIGQRPNPVDKVVSTEARAMYNVRQAGLTYWSPNINIYRDPRWGRGHETPGEDPFVASRYAVSYVRGLQDVEFGAYGNESLKVAACCKHYTAYDLDNWNDVDRFHFNARVTDQDLEDTYQPPFRSCVEDGNAACLMCSFNRVNGVPTCADKNLLKGTVRGEWNLNGYIAADCDSVDVIYNAIHYTELPEDAAAATIEAGLNVDCGNFLGQHTEDAIRNRKLNESAVDESLTELYRVLMRLGFFDGDPATQQFGSLGPSDVCSPEHNELAAEAARQGIVLLKNAAGTLPLSRSALRSGTLAVVGPNANATSAMIANYAGVPCHYVSPLQGLSRNVLNVQYAAGCADIACTNDSSFGDAITAADEADAVLVVVGLDLSQEREGFDRTSLKLPGLQQELVSLIASVAKVPIILVIMSGGPIDVQFAVDSPNIGAILWVGYPGQEGGRAIADVIFGDHNPTGKLPVTWYPDSYSSIDYTDLRIRPDPSTGYPGRTYRFHTGPVLFPFGYGLSYSKFNHSLRANPTSHRITRTGQIGAMNTAQLPGSLAPASPSLNRELLEVADLPCDQLNFDLDVEVSNVGGRKGGQVLLIFWKPPADLEGAPAKQLVAFERVAELDTGSASRVAVRLNVCQHLSFPDRKSGRRVVATGDHEFVVGKAAQRVRLF